MSEVVNGFDTSRAPCFAFFNEIRKIPRPSFHEEKIADYLVEFAKQRGLWVNRDGLHNVIIKKAGTKGKENDPPMILQAHTDMVCQKEPDSKHDFLKDPIDMYVDAEGLLRARGTTLGADDGAGVAIILGLLDEPDLAHPPLECVFTTQEEDGMGGALGLDYSLLSAKRMIGLDGNYEGTTMFSASGVIIDRLMQPITPIKDATVNTFLLSATGLTSGHGGINIGYQQANAIKVCARILHRLKEEFGIRLVSIAGGDLMCVVPRDCEAVFAADNKINAERILNAMLGIAEEIKHEYQRTDPHMEIQCKQIAGNHTSKKTESDAAINLIYLMPVGANSRTPDIMERVEGSHNMSIIKTVGDKLVITVVCRANRPANLEELNRIVKAYADVFGAEVKQVSKYAGHCVSESSPLTKVWEDVYRRHTGKKLERVYGHCGLDAGTIFDSLQLSDLITAVPRVLAVHTTKEYMDLDSFYRTYQYFKDILAAC